MPRQSLEEALQEVGFLPQPFVDGRTYRLRCPTCNARDEDSLDLTVDDDGLGAVWNCHRGKCGWRGNIRLAPRDRFADPGTSHVRRNYDKPAEQSPDTLRKPESMYEFFAKRGISRETVDLFGCYVTRHSFPKLGDRHALVFPYTYRGEL